MGNKRIIGFFMAVFMGLAYLPAKAGNQPSEKKPTISSETFDTQQYNKNNDLEENPPLTIREKTIGVGRLRVSLNHDIPLYHTETGQLVDTIRFSSIDEGENKGRLKISTKYTFTPLVFFAGDSEKEGKRHINQGLTYFVPSLTFRVLKCVENGYEIVLNEELFETAIIRNDDKHKLYTVGKQYWGDTHYDEVWFLYETWDAYLMRVASVSLRGQKLYDEINGKEIKDEMDYGRIMDVKGNWMKIKSPAVVPKIAWLQWTDGKEFLVRVTEEYYK